MHEKGGISSFLSINVSNSRTSRDFSKIVNHLSTIVEIILPPGIFEELLFLEKGIKLDQVVLLRPAVGKNYCAILTL